MTDTGRYLVIIFTKKDNLLRVISARDMNRKVSRFYEKNG
ncbi:MAG: BrnT family toxin [Deltaproteobacteria bacterium]|nr:BrnT family toxin [Deltaproteobacteria bacterium]